MKKLKYALGGVQFHSKKDDFVEMELLAHFIIFNVVSSMIGFPPVMLCCHKLSKEKTHQQFLLSVGCFLRGPLLN